MKNQGLNLKRKLLIVLMVLVGCFQVTWASDLEVKTTVGINGKYKYNRDIPVSVVVNNGASDFKGEIQVEVGNSGIAYCQEISVAGGSTQSVTIPINSQDNYYDKGTVRILDESGKEVLSKTIYLNGGTFTDDQMVIGILSDDTSSLSYFKGIDLRISNSYQTWTMDLKADYIDEKSKNLDMLDIIIINNYNTSALLPEQIASLRDWVSHGGTLIVGTGINGNKTLSGLIDDFIPVQVDGFKNEELQLLDGASLGVDVADLKSVSDEVSEMKVQENYEKLYKSFAIGVGKVLVTTYDLGLEPMASYEKNQEVWKQIFTNEVPDSIEQNQNNNYIENQLNRVRNKNLPSTLMLLIVLVAYIFVMGIVTYLILRKKAKKEYIWAAAPILALGVTLIFYILSRHSTLAPFVVNELDIVQIDGYGNASNISYIGTLNTRGKDLTVNNIENTQFSFMGSTDDFCYYSEPQEITKFIRYEGNCMSYKMTGCSVYDNAIFVTEPHRTERPNYTTGLVSNKTQYEASFTNASGQKIDRLLIVMGTHIWDLGEVEVGANVKQSLNTVNNGYYFYDLLNKYDEGKEQEQDYHLILQFLDQSYLNSQYSALPRYIAITEAGDEDELSIMKDDYERDFHYKVILGEISVTSDADGLVTYPYDYFKPYVEIDNGNGYINQDSPVMTIDNNVEAVLDYVVDASVEVQDITIGTNTDAMLDYYFNDLQGEVCLYNYVTGEYELLDLSFGKEHKIQGDEVKQYLSNHTVKIKVIGQNEDSGLVPSIKVGGVINA